MSTIALSRRAILAGAASVPALALPALIASAPAAVAAGTGSRPLLRLSNGDKIVRPKTPKAETPAGAFQSAIMRTSPRYAT